MMMGILEIVFRILPWLMTTVSANVIHYRSLWEAKREARMQFQLRKEADPENSKGIHETLSFDLMRSPPMRKVRYKVKLVRYSATLLHLLLFYLYLPELSVSRFSPGMGTLEGLVGGLLVGCITIHLNENWDLSLRTLWRPKVDFHSKFLGSLWDGVRVVGVLTVPLEDELFYHSWLYRSLVQWLSKESYDTFADVSFKEWNWTAWLASNAAFALYNGQEWMSSGLVGLLSAWVIGRRGQFLDGVWAHTVSKLVVNLWVLSTGQRQYW